MFRYDRLNELVVESGKTKAALSRKMGHSSRYLNDAKKQNTDIKGADLEILASELGTTPEYLSGQTDQKETPLTPEGEGLDADLVKMLTSLTQEEAVQVRAFVQGLLAGRKA